MVKAFFFDLDDTLYDYTTADILAKEAVREYCLQNLSISGAVYDRQLAKAYVVAEERIGRECAAVHNRLIRYQCMLEMLKKPLFPHAYKMYRLYWDTLMKQMTLEEGGSLVMKQLKEQGVYVGICTNMTAEIQYQKIEKLGITRWIDGVVTSEIFRHILILLLPVKKQVWKSRTTEFFLCAEKKQRCCLKTVFL